LANAQTINTVISIFDVMAVFDGKDTIAAIAVFSGRGQHLAQAS
jgi:hypothetical protein